jgi:hypothetical protein
MPKLTNINLSKLHGGNGPQPGVVPDAPQSGVESDAAEPVVDPNAPQSGVESDAAEPVVDPNAPQPGVESDAAEAGVVSGAAEPEVTPADISKILQDIGTNVGNSNAVLSNIKTKLSEFKSKYETLKNTNDEINEMIIILKLLITSLLRYSNPNMESESENERNDFIKQHILTKQLRDLIFKIKQDEEARRVVPNQRFIILLKQYSPGKDGIIDKFNKGDFLRGTLTIEDCKAFKEILIKYKQANPEPKYQQLNEKFAELKQHLKKFAKESSQNKGLIDDNQQEILEIEAIAQQIAIGLQEPSLSQAEGSRGGKKRKNTHKIKHNKYKLKKRKLFTKKAKKTMKYIIKKNTRKGKKVKRKTHRRI